jgi:N-acetyl-anhydromuramyl-L-alanine amidase AmpD
MNHRNNQRKHIRWDHILIWLAAVLLTALAVCLLLRLIPQDDIDVDNLLEESQAIVFETEPEPEPETEADTGNVVPWPDVDEQLLTINDYSRPGKECISIDKIVIHYLGNPKTTAQQNHDYFESLKDLQDTSMSANFVIGLEGEIIECVPPGEVAYASNSMNSYSVSIENCHLDSTGKFTEATYESLIHLTAWLVEEYGLTRDDIIRHYDVTGKDCPVYYVENEDKWEQLKDDVMDYIEECREAAASN